MFRLQCILSIVGRVFLIAIFLMSALGNKIPNFNQVAQYMATEGVPAPKLMLAGAIVFLVAGSLSILVGFWPRIGALLLAIFLVLATYYFHDFWTMQGPEREMQMIHFMKNLSLLGAMLLVMANGVGPCTLDDLLRKRTAGSRSAQS